MSTEKDKSFVIYNSKTGWRTKVTQGLKATGENQLKEVRIEADEIDGVIEQGLDQIETWAKMCKERHIKLKNKNNLYDNTSRPFKRSIM